MDVPPVEGEEQQKAVGFSLLKDAIWLRLETAAEGTWPARVLTLATSAPDDPGIHRLAELVGATPGSAFKGQPQRGSPATAWLKEQSEKLAPTAGTDDLQRNAFQEWMAGLTTNAEAWAKVPYDVVRSSIGLTPNTHRVATPGHDPVLGLVLGARDIVAGTCTFVYSSGHWQVIKGVSGGEEGVLKALAKVVAHGFSDVFTARGLPPPLMTALQAIKVNSGLAVREGGDPVSVPNLIRHMYSNGYDLRHFATMAIVPAFAELTLRTYHFARTVGQGETLGKEGIGGRLKLA